MTKKYFEINEIADIHKKIENYIIKTPLKFAEKISEKTNLKVWLKLENFQRTGSFKIRGALNKIFNLNNEEKEKGLIAASAGNHAQGVALGSTLMGIKSTIIMPTTAPIAKIKSTKNYGSKVILYGDYFDDALSKAKEIASKKNLTLVHAFDDIDIIKGQATIAHEIVQELSEFDVILVPIGGGGILSGIGHYIKQYNPNIKIIGVEALNVNSYQQSVQKGKPFLINSKPSIADGIAVKQVSTLTFEILNSCVDEIITVKEEQIAQAMLFLMENCKIITEGSGAVTTAALLFNKINWLKKEMKVVSLVSGGNADMTLIGNIINYALIQEKRRIILSVNINSNNNDIDNLISIVKTSKAQIFKIHTTRDRDYLALDRINVKLIIDISNSNQEQEIIDKIKEKGFQIK